MPSTCTRPLPSARQHPVKGYGQGSRVERDCPRKKAKSRAGEQKNSPVDPKLRHLWFRRLAGAQIPNAGKVLIQPSKHLKSVVDWL